MGLDFSSTIYFGVLSNSLEDSVPTEFYHNLIEEGSSLIEVPTKKPINVEAIEDQLEDVRYPKILGFGIELSKIHNRSDDPWVKEFNIHSNKHLDKIQTLTVWCQNIGLSPLFFHGLTWSY